MQKPPLPFITFLHIMVHIHLILHPFAAKLHPLEFFFFFQSPYDKIKNAHTQNNQSRNDERYLLADIRYAAFDSVSAAFIGKQGAR